jgi:TonB-linked SusC/RagA family outer membrane protein
MLRSLAFPVRFLPILLFLLCPVLSFSQTRAVTGQVVSRDDQKPLQGVSVVVKGTTRATITNENGNFSIDAAENAVLTFSFVGYEALEQTVTAGNPVQVQLSPVNKAMQEVVVVGYGTQRKKDLTGSVASVNAKDLKSLPVPNVGEALQGRAAGVQVLSSGAPGSNVTIRVRGIGTINNSDPLLVIDGVPTDIPLNTINQDDIASIEVLKDASATAIYGSRGANGVVLITTKKGTAGKSRLEFSSFVGTQQATSMVQMLNASQFASLHNEMMANNGRLQNPAFADPASLGRGTDWLGALFRTARMQNYTLAYSGGSATSNYYVSGAVLDQQGIVMNTSYRRYTIQLNTESRVFSALRFGNNLTLNRDIKKSGSYDIRNTMAALPTQPIYNADGTWSGPVGQSSWYGDIRNPIGTATINENQTSGYNVIGNIYGELTILKNFKFRSTGGLQASFWDSRSWSPKYNWQPIPQPNSTLSQSYNKALTWLWDNLLTYDSYLGNDHRLTVLLGSSAQNNRYDGMGGSIQGFASTTTQQLSNGTMLPTIGGNANEWALLSFFTRANYAYKDKYLVTATVRRDGSSRFGKDNRFGTFPSASVAWRISNEEFFNVRPVNDLKFRVSYGVTGNQNIGNYSFASVLQTVQYNFNNTPVTAIVPLAIPNPGVRWEAVKQANAGFDATVLNNRVNITFDAYLKNTDGMLVPMSVPISTGYSDIVVPSINAGKVQNKGIELGINSQNIKGRFEWNTNFNVSFNRNKIVGLNDSVPLLTGGIGLNQNLSIQSAGHPVNSFYGFVTNGIFQTPEEVDNYAVQVPGSDPFNRTSPGDFRFLDLNNDGVINDNDRTYLGDPNPSVIFAMNNSLSYQGFDLGIFVQGVSGNKIFNANRITLESMAVAQNQTTAVLNRWTEKGSSNTVPRAVFNDPNKNTRISNRFVEDGSYLRLKNVTLGYTLPKRLSERAKLSSARIYLSGQNLLTITKYTGFDPEAGVNGIDLSVYPVTRIISAGINLNF